MEEELLENVLSLYKENKWSDILTLKVDCNSRASRRLLWSWPSKENVSFIKNIIDKYAIKGITSIGCGCGLLEWILKQALGIAVTGLEINKNWWISKYSVPTFIDLKYPEFPLSSKILDPTYALLFCYFNDGEAFQEYVSLFKGDVILIIGPKEGTERYTDPLPLKPNLNLQQWELVQYQEVKCTDDYIAVWVRIK